MVGAKTKIIWGKVGARLGHGWGKNSWGKVGARLGRGWSMVEVRTLNCLGQGWGKVGARLWQGWGMVGHGAWLGQG